MKVIAIVGNMSRTVSPTTIIRGSCEIYMHIAEAGLYSKGVVKEVTPEKRDTLTDEPTISATTLRLEHQMGNLYGRVIAMYRSMFNKTIEVMDIVPHVAMQTVAS